MEFLVVSLKTARLDTHPKSANDLGSGTQSWVGIDGEGVTDAGRHDYVLLRCGNETIENPEGLHIDEVLPFLYAQHATRGVSYGGYYLAYDFAQWWKTLPKDRAFRLLTAEGRASRKTRSEKMRGRYLPVDYGNWQLDVLGVKRFQFRRKDCDCKKVSCPHPKGKWMYICDYGPFFQTSFLAAIDPKRWQDNPICTDEEYSLIAEGKGKRATAELDDEMRFYNELEIKILERMMPVVDHGLRSLGIVLGPSQWYGPGQAAQAWMQKTDIPKSKELQDHKLDGKLIAGIVPQWFLDAAKASFIAGWFEIFMHGLIPGVSYGYDLNSAYPYIIQTLPCLRHGKWSQGSGRPPEINNGDICFVRAKVWTRGQSLPTVNPQTNPDSCLYIGAMLHRDDNHRILRPQITEGWFEWKELESAIRADCITRISDDRFYEWVRYEPCNCEPPLRDVANLYDLRLRMGKESALGKAAKLPINSVFGKCAQSTGAAPFGNPIYATLITSGCRRMILDSIASHPAGKRGVAMVATDGIVFLSPHPNLPLSNVLGEWTATTHENLTLFKPGVYWDDRARDALANDETVHLKSRGVSIGDFAKVILEADEIFASWDSVPIPMLQTPLERFMVPDLPWPEITVSSSFAMVSCLEALNRSKWETAGKVMQDHSMQQTAFPFDKRCLVYRSAEPDGRILWRSEPHRLARNGAQCVPYEKTFGLEDPFSDAYGDHVSGVSEDEGRPFETAFRFLTGKDF
jgi:hypothetical protein